MLISPDDLDAQYRRAVELWPFIHDVELKYRLPYMLLFAVGSRETNLTNEVGDGGHGHGIWQLDDRSHTIPFNFDNNPSLQATTAASMLRSLIDQLGGSVQYALVGYNAGLGTAEYNKQNSTDPDAGTAHDNYSADTLSRLSYLQERFPESKPIPVPPMEDDFMRFRLIQLANDPSTITAFNYGGMWWPVGSYEKVVSTLPGCENPNNPDKLDQAHWDAAHAMSASAR